MRREKKEKRWGIFNCSFFGQVILVLPDFSSDTSRGEKKKRKKRGWTHSLFRCRPPLRFRSCPALRCPLPAPCPLYPRRSSSMATPCQLNRTFLSGNVSALFVCLDKWISCLRSLAVLKQRGTRDFVCLNTCEHIREAY